MKSKELSETIKSIFEDENTTDFLEHSINDFLANLTHASLSTASNKEVISLLSMINDLERMGDHCERVAILLERKTVAEMTFSNNATKELETIAAKAIEIVHAMRTSILNRDEDPIPQALEREEQLNKLRSKFRESHIERLSNRECTATAGIIFSDMLTSFEKLGDHAFNVVEATVGIK
jgi:phosphate:Na+ symporter